MSFNNDVSKEISDVAQATLDTLENVIKNSNIDTKLQEYINDLVARQQNILNSVPKEVISSLNNTLMQIGYTAKDSLSCSVNTITEILSVMDISALNNCMQDIYENVPEDISINFNETELNIANNIQSSIKAYNANSNMNIQIKMPISKEKICSIFLFITIITILIRSGYHITEHIYSICESILANIIYNEISKKD